jgi:divalent metal cation (Fe/Co/Zn/Cd) transporter
MMRAHPVESAAPGAAALRRRGIALETATLAWNVVAVPLLGTLAASASSVALLGFGLDSLIEIGASVVVIWELTGTGEQRRRPALRLIGVAFLALAAYLLVQSVVALASGHRAAPSAGGLLWVLLTAVVMFGLAAGKRRTGHALGNEVLITEGRVTLIDGSLACAVLIGVGLDQLLGWWWADPLAGLVLVAYAAREAVAILRMPPTVDGAAEPGSISDGH